MKRNSNILYDGIACFGHDRLESQLRMKNTKHCKIIKAIWANKLEIAGRITCFPFLVAAEITRGMLTPILSKMVMRITSETYKELKRVMPIHCSSAKLDII